MYTSTSDITIQISMEEVFEYVSHMENDPLWCPEVREVEQVSEGAPGLGTMFNILARPIPENQMGGYEITMFEPPTKLEWRLWQGTSTGTGSYVLEGADNGTRITYTTKVTLPGLRKPFEPFVGLITRMHFGPRMLRNLKRILESESTA